MPDSHPDCKRCNERKLLESIFGPIKKLFCIDIVIGDRMIEAGLTIKEEDLHLFSPRGQGTKAVIDFVTPPYCQCTKDICVCESPGVSHD